MRLIHALVVLAAILWIGGVWMATAWQLRHGEPVSPPLFASTNLFAAGVLLLLLGSGASPLHLLWWFPLSAVLGVLLLAFPFWVGLNRAGLSLLAGQSLRHSSSDEP